MQRILGFFVFIFFAVLCVNALQFLQYLAAFLFGCLSLAGFYDLVKKYIN